MNKSRVVAYVSRKANQGARSLDQEVKKETFWGITQRKGGIEIGGKEVSEVRKASERLEGWKEETVRGSSVRSHHCRPDERFDVQL